MRCCLLLFAGLAVGLGCSAGSNGSGTGSSFDTGSGGAGGGGAGKGASTTASAGATGGFEAGATGAGTGGGQVGPSEVFAHSHAVLFKLDPDTKVVTTIGPFKGCSQVTDIAIDKDGVMYATTAEALFLIDKTTAVCTHVATGSYPNSLSLVPQGTLDPNEEALVGYNGSEYVRIDKTTGAVTHVGALAGGYVSSGDIVSVIHGGTYLTVKGNGCGDCIIQVDPATGALIKRIGALGHASVFGLAYWGGVAYGFDNAGQLFQIDLTNGSTTPISTGVAVSQFWGAGSTTAAPMTPR